MNVLIVDDDPAFRKILREILSHDDFLYMSIKEAEDGAQTMKAVECYRPVLVFMDIRLRDSNGLALTEKIKEMAPKTAVVVVTNHDTQEYREAAFESGAAGFISKDASLTDAVHEVIKRLDIHEGTPEPGLAGLIV